MSVQIRIPTQLRSLTAGESEVTMEGSTVGEALQGLETSYPGFGERIFDEAGAVRRFVNVFADDEDIRFLGGCETPLDGVKVLSIVPAVAGG